MGAAPDPRHRDGTRRQPSLKETIVAKPSRNSPSDRTPANPKHATPLQNLPAKDARPADTDKVKGGVKKTMSTQA